MGPSHLLCWVQVGLDTLHWDLYTIDRMAKIHWDLNEKLPHEVSFMEKKVLKFVTPALLGFVTPAFIAEVNGALWTAINAGGSSLSPIHV